MKMASQGEAILLRDISILFVCGVLLTGPALAFEPLPNQLTYDEVAKFATPGALWCMEPVKNTCGFMSVSTEPVKQNPRYDVIEMWDNETILTSHTGGVLRRDGLICERGSEFINSVEVTDLEGTSVSNLRLAEIKAELRGYWDGNENVSYCYAYVPNSSGEPGMFDQVGYVDGELSESVISFFIDYAPNALENYTLRPPE